MAKKSAHLLPPNSTPFEEAVINAIIKQFEKRLPMNTKRKLWNANTCAVHLLPWLAWTVGLEEWDSAWPERVKRAQIRDAITVAKKRGTRGSIEKALKNYGVTIAIKEWWQHEPKKQPHTFDVTVVIDPEEENGLANKTLLESVKRDIDRNKPKRSHYTMTQGLKVRSDLKLIGAMRGVVSTRLKMQTDVQGRSFMSGLAALGALRAVTSTRLKLIIEES